ncbi:potassium/proton antiporter, CPA1 family [Gracilibacillus ureilyticus]|uniref:Potassium/proton antiporter, CPA1 family n=1 Tax=Gracilibacillus ureilyticus TaxID=531814 RepID=A0A1H9NDD7_9BACI|nr:potassium/proton antiporter [Gracilibacillus ureilyticus]SER33777.1 potassium/proton antiporter, CPA1 family [Gracilibacillus ureilyticus]
MEHGLLTLEHFIFVASLLLIVGVLTTKISTKLGVPALILFIVVGMVSGSEGLGFIYFDNAQLAQVIGIIALVIILFEGGLQTKFSTVRSVAKPALSLATLGVLLTTTIVAIAAKLILDIGWFEAFLFGSIVGSTDAAAVFSVLKGQNIKERLGATLEVESGTNDPMAVFLTISFIQLLTIDNPSYILLILSFFWQMGIGLLIGFLLGKLGIYSINRVNLDSSGLYPVFAVAFALLAYSITDFVGASGLLAVYFAAMIIGNADLTYRHSIVKFNEGFAWIMQILMFVILGLLVFPSQLFTFDVMWKGLLLAVILIIIARPIAVFLSIFRMGFEWRERIFLSWAGLRGAVPIVLATFPLIAGIEDSPMIFNVVFFVVLTSTLLQGSTIAVFAKSLKLTGPKKVEPSHSLELVSIGKANAEIMEYEVNEESTLNGSTIKDIDFPQDVLINAIIRHNDLVTPTGDTKINAGDILYILVSKRSKLKLNRLLKA